MLDPNVLAQLNQLKTNIQSSKDYAEGTVASTSGRFGFVRTDDGRDVFLSPDKMERVLHGDRVKIEITENTKGKLEGNFEKFIKSDIKKFVGQYRVRGAGHFVVPGGSQFTRWIFIPPAQRKGAREGEFVVAKMARHPFKDGKAQAHITHRIGQPDDNYIEHKFTKAKYELIESPNDRINKETAAIEKCFSESEFGERTDLSASLFFTIDGSNTLDMDDALSIEKTETGYTLKVAIADPASFIQNGSEIAKQAKSAAQSVYLIGGTVPMLPAALAHYTFSLEANKLRPAIVATFTINSEGQVTERLFERALIKSHAKLSYDAVAEFLDSKNSDAIPATISDALSTLAQLSQVRREFRESHYLVSGDQADYDFKLNDKGQIDNIQLRSKTSAHQLVEEAMIIANIEAGAFLAEHKCGLHMTHKGFREDRIGEVKALLKEEKLSFDDINTLDGHIALLKGLDNKSETQKLVPAIRRMMCAAELSSEAEAHLGMGLTHYATITSPIRRFADLYNHWCLNAILGSGKKPQLNSTEIEALNGAVKNGRQADRELQQWLIAQFAQSLIGTQALGKIRIVTQQGFGVKLNDNGVEGFVLFGKKTPKTFDAKRMTLSIDEHTHHIDDEVRIEVEAVDLDKRRIAFKLVTSSEHTPSEQIEGA